MAGRTQTLRIIAGEWRGRKLHFTAVKDLRPTPDRVRETVFNWLMADIEGAVCLDLFAGSGALSWEALSRGAQHVVAVELNSRAVASLQQQQRTLNTDKIQIIASDAQKFLRRPQDVFDIVFLDPPYQADLLAPVSAALESSQCLAHEAIIYLECPSRQALPQLPDNWQQLKHKQAGEVGYYLFKRHATAR